MAGFKFTLKNNTNKDNSKFQDLQKINKTIRIGIFGGKTRTDTNLTNADIGSVMEFGSNTQQIPARSFLRMPIEFNKKKIIDKAFQELKSTDISNVLTRVGLFIEGIIQKAFATRGFGNWADNTQSTIGKKGSSSPLIDTGQLRKSIASKVVDK